eukprot:15462124-Alexandrium_andersonii.AAC.1
MRAMLPFTPVGTPPPGTPVSSRSVVETPRYRENVPADIAAAVHAAGAERAADPSALSTEGPAILARSVIELVTRANQNREIEMGLIRIVNRIEFEQDDSKEDMVERIRRRRASTAP